MLVLSNELRWPLLLCGWNVGDKLHEATESLKEIDVHGIAAGALHIGQTATGVQGFHDRREAKEVIAGTVIGASLFTWMFA